MAWYAYEHTYLGHFMMMEPTGRRQALGRTGLHFFHELFSFLVKSMD